MKKGILFLCTVLAAALPVTAQTSVFPDPSRIAMLASEPGWDGLEKACSSAMKTESHAVADFSPPPHYTASGPREESENSPVPSLRRDSLSVYRLALCYKLSNERTYRAKAESILDNWAHTTTRIGTDQGKDGFNFYFPFALMGASLLGDDASWNQTALQSFVRNLVLPANNMEKPNNHGTWGVLLTAAAGGYLKDPAIVDKARNRWLELMRSQVAEDGSLTLEICRSNTSDWCGGETKGIKGMAYTHYNLEPAAISAEIFRNQGKDVYGTLEGQLLGKAYRKAAAWTLHPETFPFYESNHGKLIGLTNIDYFFILQQRFSNEDGTTVLKKYGNDSNDPYELRALYHHAVKAL